ncbi:MAG: tetratricopeptide repeat protein [Nitrospirota bacterium]
MTASRTATGIPARVFLILAPALLAIAAHGGALGGKFHYDDHFSVVSNPAVRSWHPARAFTSAEAVNSERGAAGYRPLTVASLAINHRLSGLNPAGYLATNLALHALAAVLVAAIGWRLFGHPGWGAAVGAVFALHPINAEAVNYVTARSSLLSTACALAAVHAFLKHSQGRAGVWTRAAGLAAFVGALLSKESAVVLVVPLLAYPWLNARSPMAPEAAARSVRWAAVHAALAALFVALYWYMTRGGVAPQVPSARPAWTYLELVERSLWLWLWPWPLGLDHPLTFLLRFDAALAVVLLIGAVGVAAAFVLMARRIPVAAWGLLWAVAGLAPLAPLPWMTTVGLLQEHRMAFSAAGLSLMTIALVHAAWERVERRGIARLILAGAAIGLMVAAIAADRSRSAAWQDDRRLWSDVVQWSPDNMLARSNLGSAYMEYGEYDQAEREFRAILTLAPSYPRVYYNLGLLALRRNRPDEATAAFERVIALAPRDAGAWTHVGILALRSGDAPRAERAFETALEIDPMQRDALNNLATIYLERRDWLKAFDLTSLALQRDPAFLEAAYNRGVALAGLGRRDEAVAELSSVRQRLPPDATFDRYRTGIDLLVGGEQP